MNGGQGFRDDPILNMTGERVALGPLRRDLVSLYLAWMNDFAVTRTLATGWRPTTRESEDMWYDNVAHSRRDAHFTVYERATLRPIGNTALQNIDHLHRTAELGLMIGEKDCWGRGYGGEATALVLDYGFTGLGLHAIMLRVYSHNERALRTYTRAGFRLVGRLREAHRFGGQAHDVIFMDCLATEFTSPLLQRLRDGP